MLYKAIKKSTLLRWIKNSQRSANPLCCLSKVKSHTVSPSDVLISQALVRLMLMTATKKSKRRRDEKEE